MLSRNRLGCLLLAFFANRVASYAVYEDTDYTSCTSGNPQATSVANCQALCTAKAGCTGYTFQPQNDQTGAGPCYLRTCTQPSALTPASVKRVSFRGTCAQYAASAPAGASNVCTDGDGYATFYRYDLNSGNVAVYSGQATVSSCASLCSSFSSGMTTCGSFTSWGSPGSFTCYLKSAGAGAATPSQLIKQTTYTLTTGLVGTCASFASSASAYANANCYNRESPSQAAGRRKKRSVKQKIDHPCGDLKVAYCPILGRPGSFECVDTQVDLDSCGGCGRDCAKLLPFARYTGCQRGKCIALTCRPGYTLVGDNCLPGKAKRTPRQLHRPSIHLET